MKERVSKNYYKGERITDAMELLNQASTGKAIYHTNYGVKPAAFIVSMQFRTVMRFIVGSNLFKLDPIPEDQKNKKNWYEADWYKKKVENAE